MPELLRDDVREFEALSLGHLKQDFAERLGFGVMGFPDAPSDVGVLDIPIIKNDVQVTPGGVLRVVGGEPGKHFRDGRLHGFDYT